jgi:small subunit ribosomal protein S6
MPTKKTENSAVQQYELTFILGEKAGAEEGKQKTAQVTASIEKLGGKATKDEQWGRRELAYIIKRNRSGFYVTIWFDLPAQAVKTLEENLRFDEEIIRSLVTKAYTTAQPGSLYPYVEEEKSEKPGRGPRKEEDKSSAEEMLRRSATVTKKAEKPAEAEAEESITEEERLKKLDETLGELLKDEE